MNKNQQDIADQRDDDRRTRAAEAKRKHDEDFARKMRDLREQGAKDVERRTQEQIEERRRVAASRSAPPPASVVPPAQGIPERKKSSGSFMGFVVLVGIIGLIVHAATKNDSVPTSDTTASVHHVDSTEAQQNVPPPIQPPLIQAPAEGMTASSPLIDQPINELPTRDESDQTIKGGTKQLSETPNGLYLQVAAVSHPEDVNVLTSSLTRRGYSPLVVFPYLTTLYSVRLGPFASATEAAKARISLSEDGYSSIVEDKNQ